MKTEIEEKPEMVEDSDINAEVSEFEEIFMDKTSSEEALSGKHFTG